MDIFLYTHKAILLPNKINHRVSQANFEEELLGFPGSPEGENPPAGAGARGSIPGLEGFHNYATGQLSPCTPTTEPTHPGDQALQREATAMRSLHTQPQKALEHSQGDSNYRP